MSVDAKQSLTYLTQPAPSYDCMKKCLKSVRSDVFGQLAGGATSLNSLDAQQVQSFNSERAGETWPAPKVLRAAGSRRRTLVASAPASCIAGCCTELMQVLRTC